MEEYEKENELAEDKVFNYLNTFDTIYEYIDLHGQHKEKALQIAADKINDTQLALDKGEIVPNVDQSMNHVYKIICGRGVHSHGKPVLKNEIR